MAVELNEKINEQPAANFKQKCFSCIKGPNLIKTLVVLVCVGVVTQQLSACVNKLIYTPITTYTHFDFNRTIAYPSVTFCREPPYKYDKMLEYGLYAHPRFTSAWSGYNFSISLDELWEDITYDASEFFAQYGLGGSADNVEVTATVGFVHGRCYTLSPRLRSITASRATGYSIMLQHSSADIANSASVYPPGYHVYIHYTREPFTEVAVYNGGLVDYLYSNVGETIDVKLSVDQYVMISREEDPCSEDYGYSANACTTRYVSDKVGEVTGCSGPWMLDSNLPPCHNFTAMRTLIAAYVILSEHHNSSVCPRFCRSYLYNGFVNNRHTFAWDSVNSLWMVKTQEAALQTQLYIYFNTMMVSVYEERYNYDWNLFIADLGGSVGFLLGLSVISIMAIFEKILSSLIKPSIKAPKELKESVASNPEDTYLKGCIICTKNNLLKIKNHLTVANR